MAKEFGNQVNNLEQGTSPETEALTGAVLSRVDWGRQVLSPWVQRWLPPDGGTEKIRSRGRLAGFSQTSLTMANTNALVTRVQRAADDSAVWQPDVGSISPLRLDRFTNTIVDRFSVDDTKYGNRPLETQATETTPLTLAGIEEGASPVAEESQPSAPPLPFSVDQVRDALERQRSGQPLPPSSPAASPTSAAPVQRQPNVPSQPTPKQGSGLPFTMSEVRAALEQPHFSKSSGAPRQTPSAVERAAGLPKQSPAEIQRTPAPPPRPNQLSLASGQTALIFSG